MNCVSFSVVGWLGNSSPGVVREQLKGPALIGDVLKAIISTVGAFVEFIEFEERNRAAIAAVLDVTEFACLRAFGHVAFGTCEGFLFEGTIFIAVEASELFGAFSAFNRAAASS